MIETKVKKRKVSKKNKKSWRKHIDVKDVDAFLEDTRVEERLGIPFSQRSNADLFIVDKNTDSNIVTGITKKEYRLALKDKVPKCFSLLKPHTLVPDPIIKRNRVKSVEERKHPIRKSKENERKLKGILKLKERVALKNKTLANIKRINKHKRGEYKSDVWEEENICFGINADWMTADTSRHTFSHLGIKKRKLPASLRTKPSILPAVQMPHPGTSYNPSYKDHQNLLSEIARKEIEFMKQEAHLNRVTTKMFQKVSFAEKEQNSLKELSEGLPLKDENEVKLQQESISNDEEDDSTVKSINLPVKNVKKTLKTRRKQREQKALAYELAKARTEKKKVSDIYKLKLLQKQLDVKRKKEKLLQSKRLKLKEMKATQPKILSRIKFEPLEPDYTLTEDLKGNLRNSTPSTNLLKDRYKSFQQRNIIAPANIVLKQNKAKIKKYIKADHKIGKY